MATSTDEKKKPTLGKRFWRVLWNRPLPGTLFFLVAGIALYHQKQLAYDILFGFIATMGFLFGTFMLRIVFVKGVPALMKK